MSKEMNFIKSIIDRNFCESCIIIKQKIESHNNFVIFDKHFLNLMWSDLVEFSISNDKIRYFVTFLCDFIKRSMLYVLCVKSNMFEVFRHFQLHNEHEDNRVRRFRTNWKKNTQATSSIIIASSTTLSENQSYRRFSSKIKLLNVLSQAAIQKQDCGITWCDYSHVMWLRWLCTERDNFDSGISTYIESRSS
jgi:hypothetical protein